MTPTATITTSSPPPPKCKMMINRTPSSYPSAPTAMYKYTIVWLEYFLHPIILKVLRVSLKPVRYCVF